MPRPEAGAPADLAELQAWFQAAVVRPGLPRAARGPKPAPAAAHVLPSDRLTSDERVAIYADMHLARLHGTLAEEFAAVRALAGETTFDRIVRGYLADHPPASFTLAALGRALPEWIGSARALPRRALLCDVARLERAMAVVFDAPRERALSPEDLAALPAAAWEDPRPRLIGAIDLLALSHRANAIVRAARHGEPLPELTRKRTWTVVWRKDDVVWRADLDPVMHAVLVELRAGRSLAEGVAAAERAFRGPPARLQELVARSFRTWAADGLFAAIA